ncbi:hypothetical protein [Wenyingzhuangia sp. IMCC45574]
MKKFNVLIVVLTLCTVLFLSNFDVLGTQFLMPNIIWAVPFYGLFLGSVIYFKKAFLPKANIGIRFLVIVGHAALSLGLLYSGFLVWKTNNGNILTPEPMEFQTNLKNLWFWCLYQSYLILFFFSAFKQLVTIK